MAAPGAIELKPGLQGDLPNLLDRPIPPSEGHGHQKACRDGDGRSHLQATLLVPSPTVPARGARPVLGNWQQVIPLECAVRPRERTIVVTSAGE